MNEFISVLLSLRIDYNLISAEYFKQWCTNAGFICGLLFVLIFIPMFLYSYKLITIRFNKKYPAETVIYIIKNSSSFMCFITYCYGYFFGRFLLMFICFKNLHSISMPLNFNEYIWLAGFSVSFFAIIMAFSVAYVISDKRIEIISAYKIFDKILKKHSFFLKDISTTTVETYLFLSQLDITFKSGKHFYITRGFVNYKYAAKIINKNIGELE